MGKMFFADNVIGYDITQLSGPQQEYVKFDRQKFSRDDPILNAKNDPIFFT